MGNHASKADRQPREGTPAGFPQSPKGVVLVVTSFVGSEGHEGATSTLGRESGFELQFWPCEEFGFCPS